jgi:hypothetical protein
MTIARFPTNPSFQGVNFKINTPLQKTTSFSGKTRRVAMGNQFYSFTVKFPNLTPQEVGYIQSFLAARLGGYDAFEIILPSASYTKAPSPPSGTPTVATTVAAGANVVTLSNLGANRTVIKGGDFFKFSNHSKVYIATADVVSDGSGVGILSFSGGLVAAVPSATTVVYTEVPFTVMLDGDAQSYDMGYGGITTMSLDLKEVW